ncbi:MAG: hypothetical protein JKY25_04085 [Robiginitomaculum sp.]|nr:hypothetical protein [Robiginitomaculum sp.]
MLLRSITKHVKDQNWFAVALDFFIVVAGILIAFQITNWNEARGARTTEIEYLTQLRNDLQAIQIKAQKQIDFANGLNTTVSELIDFIDAPPSQDRKENLQKGLSALVGRQSFIIHSPTFEELQNSGNLSLITDKYLRTEIINTYAEMKRHEFVIEKNNETFVDGGFTAFIRDEVGMPIYREVNQAADAPFSDQRLSSRGGDFLMEPSSQEIWDRIVQQIGYRAAIAGANHLQATRVMNLANQLEGNIDTYLEGIQ